MNNDDKRIVNIIGDLLDSDAEYIAHQCNTRTARGKNLAKSVFDRFPHANIYHREHAKGHHSTVGTIEVCGGSYGSKDQSLDRGVINMFAQKYPGKSKWDNDSYEKRLKWFRRCLYRIKEDLHNIRSIAFAKNIGCGCAGGNWAQYKREIESWVEDWQDGPTIYIIEVSQE